MDGINYKKIAVIGTLAVFVLTGLAYGFITWSSKPNSTTNPDNPSFTGGLYQTQTSVTNPTAGGANIQQDPVVSATITQNSDYNKLFAKLLAQRVVFSRVSAGGGDTDEIYKMYAAQLAEAKAAYPNNKNGSFGVAMVDITDDGVAEALVLEDMPGNCGTAGCPFVIYKKAGAVWTPILQTQVQYEVGLGNAIINGHRDIYLAKQGIDASFETAIRHYVWNGSKYAYKGLADKWTGTNFVIYEQ